MFIHGGGGIGQNYPGSCGDAPGNTYFNPAILHNGTFEKTKGYCTDVFFAQALKWIDSGGKPAQPFFAYIATNAPHAPLHVPRGVRAHATRTRCRRRMRQVLRHDRQHRRQRRPAAGEAQGVGPGARHAGHLHERQRRHRRRARLQRRHARGEGDALAGRHAGAAVRSLARDLDAGRRESAGGCHRSVSHPGRVARAKIPVEVPLDGRSLVPLLERHDAGWADRYLFTHVGRWDKGKAAQSKYSNCRVRNARFSLIRLGPEKNWQLFDLPNDPGEKDNVIDRFPEVARAMESAYEKWWAEILPCLENEDAQPPAVAPYKELFWKQFGGRPTA